MTLIASAVALAWSAPAYADAKTASQDRLTHNLAVDLPVTFAAGSLWLGSQLLQDQIALSSCRWCDRSDDGSDTLNGLDSAVRSGLRWDNTDLAGTVSDALGYVATPVAGLGLNALAAGLDGRLDEAPTNTLLILEAAFISSALTQLVKFTVGRERPFVHVLPEGQKKSTKRPHDNNVSFYSAHTNFAFAVAVSSGTIASLRGYRGAPWIWAGGLTLVTSIGYLRIAADRHYFTDVVVGATVGSLAGFVIPFVFHRKDEAAAKTGAALADISMSANSFTVRWTF